MFYAHVRDGEVTYPYTLTDFRIANPNISMRDQPDPENLAEHDMFQVEPAPEPEFAIDKIHVRTAELQDGKWVEVWVQQDAEPDIVAARIADRKRNLWEQVKARRDAIIDDSFGVQTAAAEKRALELGEAIAAGRDVDVDKGWP